MIRNPGARPADLVLAVVGMVFLTLWVPEVLSQSCAEADLQRVSSGIACIEPQQIEQIATLLASNATPEARRGMLVPATRFASCLRQAGVSGRESWTPQLLCLLQDVLRIYDFSVAEDLGFEQRLWRAELSLRFLMLRPSLPLDAPWNWESLVDRALGDYVQIYSAAAEVLQHPDDYFTAAAARRMGLDFRHPAPDPAFLESFLGLSLSAAKKYPRKLGPRISTALAAALCAGMELYPDRRRHWENAHYMLLGFDAGNLSGTAYLEEFSETMRASFALPTPRWRATFPACGEKEPEPLDFPAFDFARGQFTGLPADLERTLRELERLLSQGVEGLQDRSRSWGPWESYSQFLIRLAQPLGIKSGANKLLWQRRHRILQSALHALRQGIEYSAGYAPEEETLRLKEQLLARLESYAIELLRVRRNQVLAELMEEFAAPEGLWNREQSERVHGLAAKAYYLDGDNTSAALYASLSPITMSQLEALARRYRSLGVGIWLK